MVAFIPNVKLFDRKFDCKLLSVGKVTASVCCGICILIHDRLSIETAIDDLSPLLTGCNAVIVGGCVNDCKLDICDVSIVGRAVVNSKPDDVGMKTG